MPERADSESAYQEIVGTLIRDEVAGIQRAMVVDAVRLIANDHAPDDNAERCEYLLEVVQWLSLALATVCSVAEPPEGLSG